jgi:DNA invertase Pin-like site-specific DNA recombinase
VNKTRHSQSLKDHLPDYSDYHDEGCDLSPSCLKCPLPRCRHDKQPQGRRAARSLRDMEILKQHNSAGKSAAELANQFGVSKRTIQRIIRRSNHD